MTPHKPNDVHDVEGVLPLTPLAFHILVALGQEDLHGYGIIKDIEKRTDNTLTLRSGTLYTALQRLLEARWIETAPAPAEKGVDPRRRYFRMTDLGREVAAAEARRLERLLSDARERKLAPRDVHA